MATLNSGIPEVAAKITHEMVYEQCGTMKHYYDKDYAKYHPMILEAVTADLKRTGRYPTDNEINALIAGTVLVVTDTEAGPLCPYCNGPHNPSTNHQNPADVAALFPHITAVIDKYNA